jgi:hypothetical protein
MRFGNISGFLRQLWEEFDKAAKKEDLEALAAERGYLNASTLSRWGVCKHLVTGQWVMPGFNHEGKLCNLYRWVDEKVLDKQTGRMILTGRRRMIPTAGLQPGHHLHAMLSGQPVDGAGAGLMPQLGTGGKGKIDTIYLCEGPFDAMALWEVLSRCRRLVDDRLVETGNPSVSMLANAVVLAVPGCNVFYEQWAPLFAGKQVYLLYDNDYPKPHPKTGTEIGLQGWRGMEHVCKVLADAGELPSQVLCVRWGKVGKGGTGASPEPVNLGLKNGYDVRDCLTKGVQAAGGYTTPANLAARINRAQDLLNRLHPVPAEWVAGRSKEAKRTGRLDAECLACSAYEDVVSAFNEAVHWTDRMDVGLSVCLACILSTPKIGDQLWIKLTGPPSCLAGDTAIHDPVDGSDLTVKDRQRLGKRFWVWTRRADGTVGVAEAMPPTEFPATQIYKVTLASGQVLRLTAGHRIWDGGRYLSVAEIGERLQGSLSCPLVSISGTALSTLLPGVRRWTRKVGDCRCGCPDTSGQPQVDGQDSTLPPRYTSVGRVLEWADPCSLTRFDIVVQIEKDGVEPYYDFLVPETNNYWAGGLFHHNSGKTLMADALMTNRRYCNPKSVITGFHSGWKDKDGENSSLLAEINYKTLITKEGDALLQMSNLGQILSQARDLYDGKAHSHYGNRMGVDWEVIRATWLLCGTSPVRWMDAPQLGERFLDVVLLEDIDDDEEDRIALRAVYQAARDVTVTCNGKAETRDSPEMVKVKGLTGGYIAWLRTEGNKRLEALTGMEPDTYGLTPEVAKKLAAFGKFVAYMRSRPPDAGSKKRAVQEGGVQREMSPRLSKQMTRLAMCLMVVLQKDRIDSEVLRRVRQVAVDTAGGKSLKVCRFLENRGTIGAEIARITSATGHGEEGELSLLHHLMRIRAVEYTSKRTISNPTGRIRFRLTPRMLALYRCVMAVAGEEAPAVKAPERKAPSTSPNKPAAKRPPASKDARKPRKGK